MEEQTFSATGAVIAKLRSRASGRAPSSLGTIRTGNLEAMIVMDGAGALNFTAANVDSILRSEPSDLPIPQPSRFSLILNLKTAKAAPCQNQMNPISLKCSSG